MTRRRFARLLAGIALAVFLIAVAISQSAIPDMLGRENTMFDRSVSGGAIFFLFWIGVFPALRYGLRARFRQRLRPLWWAEIPGALSLFGILVLTGVVIAANHGIHLYQFSDKFRWTMEGLAFVPQVLGVIAGIAAIIDAFGSDRNISEPEIFS